MHDTGGQGFEGLMAGRLAVVTGGGKGIGRAIAARLAQAGDRVLIAGRDRAALDATAGEIEGIVDVCECDVTQEAEVAELFKRAGNVEVLVNNAGVETSAPIGRTELSEWSQQPDVNATGAFLCTRAVVPGMLGLRRFEARGDRPNAGGVLGGRGYRRHDELGQPYLRTDGDVGALGEPGRRQHWPDRGRDRAGSGGLAATGQSARAR